MHKTIAEAEAFVGALLPRVGAVADVDVAVCPPFTALAGGRRVRARLRRRGVRADHAPGAVGRLHGRGQRADARPSSTSTGSCWGTPSAASSSARPTARWPRRSRPRSTAGLQVDPVRGGDRGRARARRDRAQAAPPGPGGPRAARRRGARRRRHRLRADLGDRHGPRGHPRAGAGGDRRSSARSSPTATGTRPSAPACSTAGRSSPTTPPSCSRCPTSTGRSSAARRSRSTASRRSWRRRRR